MSSHYVSRLTQAVGLLLALFALSLLARPAPLAAATTPAITINDISVGEGNAGATSATFTILLSTTTNKTVTVSYATANGTATSGSDYVARSGTLSIPANQQQATLTVTVNGDTIPEANETFAVNLTSPSNATIGDSQGQATIVNDDTFPAISIDDKQATEGNIGLADLTFTVSLSAISPQDVTVSYATSNSSAAAGADYQAQSGIVTIPAGQLSQPVTVKIVGDALDELDETFNVDLSSPVNATIADSRGVGTILDDDLPPTLSIDDQQVIEGNSSTVNMLFTVSLSALSGKTVTVKYQTADSTAKAGTDYTALKLSTLTFQPGVQSLNVSVAVKGDTLDEDDESFTLNLSSAASATIVKSQGVGTILDDDLAPTIAIDDVAVAEPASGASNATFTVLLSAASGKPISVSYATADGTAIAGADYQARADTVALLPGETSKQITIPVNSDQTVEPNETFFVDLSSPANVAVAKGRGQGTITSTAGVPTVTIAGSSVTEGIGASAAFLVSLSAPSPQSVTVAYTVTGDTALAGSDFQVPTTLAVTFPPNSTAPQTINVPIVDDPLDEGDETFTVRLTGATSATIVGGVATGAILDDDLPPTMIISNAPVVTDSGGPLVAIFTVSLSAPSGKTITVDYQTADGSATAGADYQAQSGMLTILPGRTSATIAIPIIADTLTEASETFFVNLGNAVNTTLIRSTGVGTIVDVGEAPQHLVYIGLISR